MKLVLILLYSIIASSAITLVLIKDGIFSEISLLWSLSFTFAFCLLIFFNTRGNFKTKKFWTYPLLIIGSLLSPFLAWVGGFMGFVLWGITFTALESSLNIDIKDLNLGDSFGPIIFSLFVLIGASCAGMTTLIFSAKAYLYEELTIKYQIGLLAFSILLPVILTFFMDLSPFIMMAGVDASTYGMKDMTVLGTFAFIWQFITLFAFGYFTSKSNNGSGLPVQQTIEPLR